MSDERISIKESGSVVSIGSYRKFDIDKDAEEVLLLCNKIREVVGTKNARHLLVAGSHIISEVIANASFRGFSAKELTEQIFSDILKSSKEKIERFKSEGLK